MPALHLRLSPLTRLAAWRERGRLKPPASLRSQAYAPHMQEVATIASSWPQATPTTRTASSTASGRTSESLGGPKAHAAAFLCRRDRRHRHKSLHVSASERPGTNRGPAEPRATLRKVLGVRGYPAAAPGPCLAACCSQCPARGCRRSRTQRPAATQATACALPLATSSPRAHPLGRDSAGGRPLGRPRGLLRLAVLGPGPRRAGPLRRALIAPVDLDLPHARARGRPLTGWAGDGHLQRPHLR
jgi:hypothetical protein